MPRPPEASASGSVGAVPRASRVLLVDDHVQTLSHMAACLERRGHSVAMARSVAEARSELDVEAFDVVVLDVALPDGSGLELMPSIPTERTRIVMVTGQPSMVQALLSLHHRDLVFMPKPLDVNELHDWIGEAPATGNEGDSTADAELVGADHTIVRLRQQLGAAARRGASVILEGESGSGRDQAMRSYRQQCGRPPLRRMRTGSVDEGIRALENAAPAAAEGSICYIDDFTSLTPPEQDALAASMASQQADQILWILSTLGTVDEALAARRITPALREALPSTRLSIPPLRRRRGDVPLLLEHFCCQMPGTPRFSAKAIQYLMAADWPGNVRQLRVEATRAARRAGGSVVTEQHLSRWIADAAPDAIRVSVDSTVSAAERQLIEACLLAKGGDRRTAAASLGISLRTLYNRLNDYGRPSTSSNNT